MWRTRIFRGWQEYCSSRDGKNSSVDDKTKESSNSLADDNLITRWLDKPTVKLADDTIVYTVPKAFSKYSTNISKIRDVLCWGVEGDIIEK